MFSDIIILRALEEKDHMLDLRGGDKFLLSLCISDFRNFVGFMRKNFKEVRKETQFIPSVEVVFDLHSGRMFYKTLDNDEDIKDEERCIIEWVDWWWSKYKKRVKLYLGKPKKDADVEMGMKIMRQHFTKEEVADIHKILLHTFISHGEICATDLLASILFKKVLGRYSSDYKWTVENKLNFVSDLTVRARAISRTYGPLIFLRPDKNYYLREFRDRGEVGGSIN